MARNWEPLWKSPWIYVLDVPDPDVCCRSILLSKRIKQDVFMMDPQRLKEFQPFSAPFPCSCYFAYSVALALWEFSPLIPVGLPVSPRSLAIPHLATGFLFSTGVWGSGDLPLMIVIFVLVWLNSPSFLSRFEFRFFFFFSPSSPFRIRASDVHGASCRKGGGRLGIAVYNHASTFSFIQSSVQATQTAINTH